MTATPEPEALWTLANQLLECAAAELDLTVARAPERRCVVYGQELVWDDCHCGLLAVHVPRTYLSETFPVIKQTANNCDVPFTVAELVVTILRCVPQPDNSGAPPTCEAMANAARVDFADRAAVYRGVACCLGSADPRRMYAFLEHLAVGEGGACAGSELHVLIAMANCVECP